MRDRRRLTNIVGGSAGNLVEWFDWYVYAAFALYFAPTSSPGRPDAQLLQTAAVFAVGFVVRPIGAWAMGIYADHKGRKAGLTLSVSLMCPASLLIAVAPTYAQAGILSPAILLIARLLQGSASAANMAPAPPICPEMADREPARLLVELSICDDHRRAVDRAGAAGGPAGLLGEQAMLDWGWRIGFLVGAVLAIVVFFIRRRLDETVSFDNVAGKRIGRNRLPATCSASIRARPSW